MVNIGIIASNSILSQSYSEFFTTLSGYRISFTHHNIVSIPALAESLPGTDIVMIDLLLAEENLAALQFIKQQWPDARVIIFTSGLDSHTIMKALQAGADAYLLKTEGLFELHKAATETLKDGLILSPAIARSLVNTVFSSQKTTTLSFFTSKENEIIRLVQQGLSYKEMAKHLNITAFTVNHHLKNIYKKGGVNSRSQLMALLQQKTL